MHSPPPSSHDMPTSLDTMKKQELIAALNALGERPPTRWTVLELRTRLSELRPELSTNDYRRGHGREPQGLGEGDQPEEAAEGLAYQPVPGSHGTVPVRTGDHSSPGKEGIDVGHREHRTPGGRLRGLREVCRGHLRGCGCRPRLPDMDSPDSSRRSGSGSPPQEASTVDGGQPGDHEDEDHRDPEQDQGQGICEWSQQQQPSHRRRSSGELGSHQGVDSAGQTAAARGQQHEGGQGGETQEGTTSLGCADDLLGRDRDELQDGQGVSGQEPRPEEVVYSSSVKQLSPGQAHLLEQASEELVPDLFQGLVAYGRPVVMEVACMPDSLIGQAVQERTGTAESCSRVSIWNRGDLGTKEGIRLVLDRICTEKPHNVWIATPCGPYSPLQRTNARTPEQSTELERKRAWAKRIYVGASIVARYAFQMGCHVTWEWSERCEAWRFPWVQKMIRDLELRVAVTHGCRVNLRSSLDKRLLKKGWKIATSHPRLAEVMQATCKCDRQYQHGRCEGQDASQSARYTKEYAVRVAKVMCLEMSVQQVRAECQGKSQLAAMFGLGPVRACDEPHIQQQQHKCGHCTCQENPFLRARERDGVDVSFQPAEPPEMAEELTETGETEEDRQDPAAAEGTPKEKTVLEPADPQEMEEGLWSQTEVMAVEDRARELLKSKDFSREECERLLSMIPSRHTSGRQNRVSNDKGQYWVFGAYAHGGQSGVTSVTRKLPNVCRYVNSYLQSQGGQKHKWSSFAISRNVAMPCHRDVNNDPKYPNLVIGMGEYTGGELWVQENVESHAGGWDKMAQPTLVSREDGKGNKLWGRMYPTKNHLVVFPPKAWHKTEPWKGQRTVVSAYVSRGHVHISEEDRKFVQLQGFSLPPRPRESALVTGREGEQGKEADRIRRQLYLLHAATGHCSTIHLVNALKRRGARPEVIRLAEQFRCSICDERKRVMPRHVASLEPLPPKFHTVSADVGHWYNAHKKEHVQFLVIIDEGSRFRIARVVSKGPKQQPSGATCVQYLQEGWSQIFGQPRTLRLDPAGNFRSKAVEQYCDSHEIFLDLVPGEAHWKIGVCEQAVQGLKEVMTKIADANQEITSEEALADAVRVFNQRDMVRGFSPAQHVLGQAPDETGRIDVQSPAVPPELLVENPTGEFQRAVERRQEAEKALADWAARQRLVRAQNSRTRNTALYRPGDLVFFWRCQDASTNRQGPNNKRGMFLGPARILAMEQKNLPDGAAQPSSSVWLVRGRQLLKVSVEQLRPASNREELLETLTEDRQVPWSFRRVSEQIGGNQYEDLSGQKPTEAEWNRAQDPTQEVQPAVGRPEAVVRHRFRGKRPAAAEVPESSEDEELIPAEPSTSSRRRMNPQAGGQPVNRPDGLQGARWFEQVEDSAWYGVETAFWSEESACVEVEVEIPTSQRGKRAMFHNLEGFLVNSLKRKAVEVSERHLTPSELNQFKEAKAVEVKNFIAAKAFESLPNHLRPDKSTAMGMRWCLTWKLKDNGETKAKARAVLLGYQDAQYEHRATNAPVMTRQSRQMLLQEAANRDWTVFKGDVSGAFLQGQDYEGTLHVVPCDEICEAMGLEKGSVTRLRKACYGLVEAPLQWYRSVHAFFTEIGLERTWSDSCTWVWRPDGVLRGQVASHVDDFMFAGRSDDEGWQRILEMIKQKFKWGDWEKDDFTQCGVRIQKQGRDYVLSQEQYVSSIQEIPLNASRRKERKEATKDREKTQLRALLGALSWLAQQTAPHLSAEVGLLLSEVGTSTVETIIRANTLLSKARELKGHRMIIHAFEPEEDLALYAWVDAGSQNRPDGGSTQGIVVGIGPVALQEGELGKVSLMAWHSSKIDRACRSPGAAEAQAAVNGEDCLFYARYQWGELEQGQVDPRNAVETVKRIPGCLVTDSRNVFDKLKEEVLVIKGAEKRTSIELIGLKEAQWTTQLCIRWVHSEAQLANSLTKHGGNEIELYYQMGQWWKIVEDPKMRSARKRRSEGMSPLEGNAITGDSSIAQTRVGEGGHASKIACEEFHSDD